MAEKSGSCSAALQWVERLLEPSASEEMMVEAVSSSLELCTSCSSLESCSSALSPTRRRYLYRAITRTSWKKDALMVCAAIRCVAGPWALSRRRSTTYPWPRRRSLILHRERCISSILCIYLHTCSGYKVLSTVVEILQCGVLPSLKLLCITAVQSPNCCKRWQV